MDGDTGDSGECYGHGTFPSPVAPAVQERFTQPLPLPAPSPTEDRTPIPTQGTTTGNKQRYHQEKYHFTSPNPSSERYYQYKDRYQLVSASSPSPGGGFTPTVNNGEQRFVDGQRYIPPNAHMPVERYVPQPPSQEPLYNAYQTSFERYGKTFNATTDPYMRRDLTYHYRLPVQYAQNQYQKIRYSHVGTPSRSKCCQYELPRSSPGSSSSNSSVASGHASSLQDIQCQNYQPAPGHYQQEKGTQCPIVGTATVVAVPVRAGSTLITCQPCRHGGGCEGTIEYVGASGGRRICATPPPRPQERCEGCIQAAAQAAAVAAAAQHAAQAQTSTLGRSKGQQQQQQTWRSSTPNGQPSSIQSSQPHHPVPIDQQQNIGQLTPRHVSSTRSLTPTNQRSLTPTTNLSSSGTEQSALSTIEANDDRREETLPRLRHNSMQNVTSSSQNLSVAPSNLQAAPQTALLASQNIQNLHTAPSNITGAVQAQSISNIGPTSHSHAHASHSEANRGGVSVQRAVSLPAKSHAVSGEQQSGISQREGQDQIGPAKRVNYSQSERIPNRDRPPLNRSQSKKEMIKNYIKKETANFFGVDEENEDKEQKRWLDRRKRMASRTMGALKDEYTTLSYQTPVQASPLHLQHRRVASEAAAAPTTSGFAGQLIPGGRPDVLPGERGDITDGAGGPAGTGLRRKDSVARMTWDGLNYVVTTISRHRSRARASQTQNTYSRSFPPDIPPTTPISDRLPSPEEEAEAFFEKGEPTPTPSSAARVVVDGAIERTERPELAYRDRLGPSPEALPERWRRDHEEVVLRHPEHRAIIGSSRISPRVIDSSNKRQFGMGWVSQFFRRSYRKSVMADAKIQEQLDDLDDHRPFFTYWVTTVQVLVLFISLLCYGFGPFGFNLQSRSGQVLVTSLSLQQVDYMEPANFWLGPRAADLIHLGAKFAPCMRLDDKIIQEIERTRKKEKETACCIRNDDSGCVQTSQADCSLRGLRPTKTISTWKKWSSGDTGPGGRISGSVCGLDPKYCDAPASVHPYEWPDDITKWPICRKTNSHFSQSVARKEKGGPRDKLAEHMVCEVIGHPCCIGIHGQCRITTREYCDFVHGRFHEEASLCSQVSCLNDVCGMIPFYVPDVPDQFYRLWTSLFLHAGVVQLFITILVQYFLMKDLEKLTGSLRIGIIYIGSGVGGNLASAIFVPYRADVGPAGSQFGLLACLIVEVLNAWPMLKHPNKALCKLLSITMVLFLIGLLPWVDNYAHLFGFVFGFLLSYALLPFISFGRYDRHKKIFYIWVCLLTALFLFGILVLLFYIIPVYDCKICSYLNCLPLTRDFCASQNINFKREEPIV